ncbi:unnamed protein product [Lampetra planeri]
MESLEVDSVARVDGSRARGVGESSLRSACDVATQTDTTRADEVIGRVHGGTSASSTASLVAGEMLARPASQLAGAKNADSLPTTRQTVLLTSPIYDACEGCPPSNVEGHSTSGRVT